MDTNSGDDNSKNVVNLSLVSFFTDLSTEMILGILPIYLIRELGTSRSMLGLIEGFGESVSYTSRTLSGAVSDWCGRRKVFVLLGYTLSTVSKPFFALSTIWTQGLVVRVIDRLGKGVRTAPRDALLSDSVKRKVGRAFGLHRSADQAGAIVGPLLAFALIPLIGIRGILWISFIPGTVALMILLLLVKEKTTSSRKTSIISNFKDVLNGRFLLLLLVFTVFSLGAFNFSFVLLTVMDAGIAVTLHPIVLVVINIGHTAIGYPSGLLSDRIGGEKTLIVGYLFFLLVSTVGLLPFKGLIVVLVMATFFGLYVGISETVQRAIIPRYVSSELRGTAYGSYYLFIGIAFLVANIVFGALWDQVGSQTAFTYSLITSSLGIIGLSAFTMRSGKEALPQTL